MKLAKRSFVTAATTISMIIVQNQMDGSPLQRSESVNTPCVCVCVCVCGWVCVEVRAGGGGGGRGHLDFAA